LLPIKPNDYLLGVRQIANDLLERLGQPAYQRRYGHDLISSRQLRIFQEVDDFDAILAAQELVASNSSMHLQSRCACAMARQ
jgi:hypothetical protein